MPEISFSWLSIELEKVLTAFWVNCLGLCKWHSDKWTYITHLWEQVKSSWRQPEAAINAWNPVARENYFYSDEENKSFIWQLCSHRLQNTPNASLALWERCECTLANLLSKKHISSATMQHSMCWRELHVWTSLNEQSKIPPHQQKWTSKTRKVVKILFLRHHFAQRHLSLDIVFVDILGKTYLNSVSVWPATGWPQAFQTSGIKTCVHANTSYNHQ